MPLSEILKCLKKFDFFYCRAKIAVAKKNISTKKFDILIFGAVNKFSFERKVSKLSEENYQKLVDAVIKLISDKK